MNSAIRFDDWFTELQELAFQVDWPLGEPGEYHEYFEDGDSPGEALAEEMSRADDDDDGPRMEFVYVH